MVGLAAATHETGADVTCTVSLGRRLVNGAWTVKDQFKGRNPTTRPWHNGHVNSPVPDLKNLCSQLSLCYFFDQEAQTGVRALGVGAGR
jgi:hypothetical protein